MLQSSSQEKFPIERNAFPWAIASVNYQINNKGGSKIRENQIIMGGQYEFL